MSEAARIAELERRLAELARELEATNEGVLALYTELDDAHRMLQEADRLKGQFLANMSHEIRTPMNAIIGLTDVLLTGPLHDHQREPLRLIREAGTSLLALINDILDFSKIEAGMLDLDLVDFSPGDLVRGAAELLHGMAQDKGLSLRVSLEEDLPAMLRGDPNRLRQILLNLIGNAIKFTAFGEVTVCAADSLYVEVRDTGIGITPEAMAQLFQPFVQGDGSITREHGGTGLGLSICKRLLELMNGEIGVESTPGQGSTFWFRVPLQKSGGLSPSDLAGEAPALPGARVLVAEDHLANQIVARYQLETLGIEAEFVSNGREAVEAVKSGRFNLVLMDCQMPEMSGYEATREIRLWEKQTGKHIPIIALTAGALAGDREKALEAGMDDYVSKPVEAETIRKVLSAWMVKSLVDFQTLENTFGPTQAAGLARIFAQEALQELAGLRSGVQARDLQAIGARVHGLRGLSLTMGSPWLVADCDHLREAKSAQDWEQVERWTDVVANDLEEAIRLLRQKYPD